MLIGFSIIINHPFWGTCTPIFGSTPTWTCLQFLSLAMLQCCLLWDSKVDGFRCHHQCWALDFLYIDCLKYYAQKYLLICLICRLWIHNWSINYTYIYIITFVHTSPGIVFLSHVLGTFSWSDYFDSNLLTFPVWRFSEDHQGWWDGTHWRYELHSWHYTAAMTKTCE